jgi:hypothetical protein
MLKNLWLITYDNGKHFKPKVHTTPFSAMLLYIPGALLRNGTGNVPADWHEITRDDQIDQASYKAFYERRLLPLLIYANDKAKSEGKKALITIPGLGCGQFAGPFIVTITLKFSGLHSIHRKKQVLPKKVTNLLQAIKKA